MKWSWRIGRVAGIDVYVHATFLLLLGWVAINTWLARGRVADVMYGLLFVSALFGIIVLHELGHALAARRYGIATEDITLLPIGGVARLEGMPEKPQQELVVALAGPAVNVVLAFVFWMLIRSSAALTSLTHFQLVGGSLLSNLLTANIMLAVFNLIPAFPMDGGRVLRALLALKLDYARATHWAATIGQAMAFMAGAVGLAKMNPFLVFIAIFVYLGAEQEADMVKVQTALDGVPIRKVMIRDFKTLSPHDTLSRAVAYVLEGFQQDFPVVDQGRVVGILTRQRLLTALARRGENLTVGQAMERRFATTTPEEEAEAAFARLEESDCRTLPVVQNHQLVGLLTAENLGEFLMIQSALRGETSVARKA
jgi:Zn-dependent protease